MVKQWVIGSILHGGLTELFLILASAPRIVKQRLWNNAYKRSLIADRKE